MNQKKLFDIPEKSVVIINTDLSSKYTCRECENRQRWQCNSKVFQYCGVRKSNRTDNGFLKIKCKNQACNLFKSCE